jgi:predicted DNA-binding transcriptional regulator AlpA
VLTRDEKPRRFPLRACVSPDPAFWSAAQVRVYFGGVSEKWLDRRIADPKSDFPKPVKLGSKRNYWRVSEIIAWCGSYGRAQVRVTKVAAEHFG